MLDAPCTGLGCPFLWQILKILFNQTLATSRRDFDGFMTWPTTVICRTLAFGDKSSP
jgi:hypothetical protein